ncbi:MAG: M14 family zinc carboxypeptidase [Bacillus sp. (in: firmicutes)]
MKVLIPFCLLFLFFYVDSASTTERPYTYENMMTDIQHVGDLFPKGLQVGTIGRSEWGKEIPYVQIGMGQRHILLIGTHHAREWITSKFLMKLVHQYAARYAEDPFIGDLLDEISVVVIPMLNPDGVQIQQQGLKGDYPISKLKLLGMNHFSWNYKRWKANGEGVDLNRQYPADWEALKKIPAWPAYKQYRGERPVQAKEVAAVVDFTEKMEPLIALAYHTSGQEVYWYYHTEKERIVRDYSLAEKIAHMTGYEVAMPESDAVGGGYTDWFLTTFQRPAFTIEMCTSVHETNPPLSCLKEEYEHNVAVPLMLIHELLQHNFSFHQ